MDPIAVETTLDVRDWRALQAYIHGRFRNTPLSGRQILVSLSGVLVTLVAIAVGHYLFDGSGTKQVVLGVLIGVGGLAIIGLLQRRAWAPGPHSSFFTPTRFRFDASGICVTKETQEGSVAWRGIEHVGETPEHLFLSLTEFSAYVIPKRAITSMPLADFIARIQGWYAQRDTAPSLVPPTPGESLLAAAVSQTQPAPIAADAQFPGFWRALRSNLIVGLRIFLLRRVRPDSIVATFDQIVALLAIVLSVWVTLDWLSKPGPLSFTPWGLDGLLAWLMLGFCLVAVVARANDAIGNTRPLLIAVLATAPWLIAIAVALTYVPLLGRIQLVLAIILAAIALVPGFRALHAAYRHVRPRASIALLLSLALLVVVDSQIYLSASLWRPALTDDEQVSASWDSDASESLLFEEKTRISAAADQLEAERAGVTDVFYLGFAGYGAERVFRREALFGQRVFGERMGSASRSLELINDEDDVTTYPLGTLSGLRHALSLLGARMNTEEDILVLLLTSHGGKESGIQVDNGLLPLNNVEPETLRLALDDAGIKWRIVIVSACYAGTFIGPLRNEATLVMTASDAESTSFGCADERDLTYFGEAFLRDALPNARSLEEAFEQARSAIVRREKMETLNQSNPQIFVGDAIREKLASLGDLPLGGAAAQ
jgi:hypothetical protein